MPLPLMALRPSESIAHEAEEPIRARGIIVKYSYFILLCTVPSI